MTISDAVAAWLQSFGPVRPFAVPISDAQGLLGKKSRSEIYKAGGNGDLDFVKDGAKTLITVDSIVRYVTRKMKPAQISPPPPKHKRASVAATTETATSG